MALDSKGSAHVTIACKVAVAWMDLQLCAPQEVMENTQTGPRKITQYARVGRVVRIRGTAYPRGEAPEGYPARPTMVAGYALTENVPKEFWDEWVKQHAKAPYVESGMIFAYDKEENIRAAAKDHKDDLSGLEPVQKTKTEITDARVGKSMNSGVGSIEPGKAA